MAVADAVLQVIETQNLQEHAEDLGSYLKEGLEGMMEKHSCIGDVRGMGLFVGVEFVKDRETNKPDPEIAHHLERKWVGQQLRSTTNCLIPATFLSMCRMLLDHRIIMLVDGMHRNVIKIKPPLTISKKDCSAILQGMDAILTKLMED